MEGLKERGFPDLPYSFLTDFFAGSAVIPAEDEDSEVMKIPIGPKMESRKETRESVPSGLGKPEVPAKNQPRSKLLGNGGRISHAFQLD